MLLGPAGEGQELAAGLPESCPPESTDAAEISGEQWRREDQGTRFCWLARVRSPVHVGSHYSSEVVRTFNEVLVFHFIQDISIVIAFLFFFETRGAPICKAIQSRKTGLIQENAFISTLSRSLVISISKNVSWIYYLSPVFAATTIRVTIWMTKILSYLVVPSSFLFFFNPFATQQNILM